MAVALMLGHSTTTGLYAALSEYHNVVQRGGGVPGGGLVKTAERSFRPVALPER